MTLHLAPSVHAASLWLGHLRHGDDKAMWRGLHPDWRADICGLLLAEMAREGPGARLDGLGAREMAGDDWEHEHAAIVREIVRNKLLSLVPHPTKHAWGWAAEPRIEVDGTELARYVRIPSKRAGDMVTPTHYFAMADVDGRWLVSAIR